MHFGVQLTGRCGESQQLYEARNEHKRGRGSQETVDRQTFAATQQIIRRQQELGFDFVTDPLFRTDYLFQPLAQHAFHEGSQENWIDDNLFCRKPQIMKGCEALEAAKHSGTVPGATRKYLHWDALPPNGLAILPSPYTLLMLSDVTGYDDSHDALLDLAALLYAEARDLVVAGIKCIQWEEPWFAYKAKFGSVTTKDIELLEEAMDSVGTIPAATTLLHTYFGDVSQYLSILSKLRVDCIGIDAIETPIEHIKKHRFDKVGLALGLIDARTTRMEDAKQVAETAKTVADQCAPRYVIVTPTSGLEYIGWTWGLQKINLLGEVRRLLHD